MILDADSSATEQIRHRGDGFTAALGAGTDGENKVTEGRLLRLAEDLRVLFHAYIILTAKRVPMFIQRAYYMEISCFLSGGLRTMNDHSPDTCVRFLYDSSH